MGIAKSIEAYAVYSEYTKDTEVFIKKMSDNLNADFIINSFDTEYEPLHEEDLLTSFSKPNRYRLTISYHECLQNDKTINIPEYTLTLPIDYEFEDDIELIFYPNNLVHIMFLTFEHMWGGFINTLKFEFLYENRQQAIERYEKLRSEYICMFKKIGIDSIFILTHAYYKIEDLDDDNMYPVLTFSDIPKIAKENDNLTSFNLEKILRTEKVTDLCKDFLATSELNIAFIDYLTQNHLHDIPVKKDDGI
jgi:hypothetical protein